MNKTTALIIGAAAVGGFVLYQRNKETVVDGGFAGYQIIRKGGFYFARDPKTGKVSPQAQDVETVQRWIGANKAADAFRSWLPIGDDLLLPPPGRTVTADGQVLDGLGYNIDAYDAAPYQYRRDPVNDLGDLGRSLRRTISRAVSAPIKAVQKVADVAVKVTNPVLKPLAPLNPVLLGARVALSTTRIAAKAMSNPSGAFKKLTSNVKSFTITPLMQAGMIVGVVKPPKVEQAAGGTPVYQDADGKPITKEDYDRLVAAAEAAKPKKAKDYKGYTIWTAGKINEQTGKSEGVLYLINYDPAANAAEGAYETMTAAEYAIDQVVAPTVPALPSTQNRYSVEQAAAEMASIRPPSDDTGIGPAADDSGFGPSSSDSGLPALPERVQQIDTPAAVMLPPQAAPQAREATGNKAVGALVGGGIIAAIAAAAFT